ncbi:GNAT family N-acetyltransferase [Traorella massiliensis]|uniref:GNAT family N-acetyltransferase n=1 Tax=Traorella massiliensis TaxID=1903263 RepID=UPI00248D50AE|nr:GNAT family N-acetyltransferase [Traorella massiliensis]
MNIEIKEYIKDRIGDVLAFEERLREEEDVWGWEIDEAYVQSVEKSFDDPAFQTSISLLAYVDDKVIGRIDSTMIASHFDGSKKAYLDWICVLKSHRHQQVAQNLLMALIQRWKCKGVDTLIALTASNDEAQRFYKSVAHSEMRDIGIWIDINQYEKL